MSDKKYPYIGEGKRTGNIVLFTSNSTGEVIVAGNSATDSYCEGYTSDAWSEGAFEDITKGYLLGCYGKTYGKCGTREHTDFIHDLAKNSGFKLDQNYSEGGYFYFCGEGAYGFGCEKLCSTSAKLIHLPLPPKEKEMPEVKPVYTKEMHERGELPPVGSEFVFTYFENGDNRCSCFSELNCEVIGHAKLDNGLSVITFTHKVKGVGALVFSKTTFLPIPTIKDELVDFVFQNSGIRARDGGNESAKDIVTALLEKYNVTLKERTDEK